MRKFMCVYIIFCMSQSIIADDFTWGEEFQEGDTISAEVFNEIFRTIEKINRTTKN